jgi:hypothetical protein
MRMVTYAQAVSAMQPIIEPIYDSLEAGLTAAGDLHTARGLVRADDPWYYIHTVRRVACDRLRAVGVQAEDDETGRPLLAMSGLMVYHRDLAIRVMHARPLEGSVDKPAEIPIPGRSIPRQRFWSQASMLPELQTDNHLLLWLDDDGWLVDRMTLVRPMGGDHQRASLRLNWTGPIRRAMACLRTRDLDELAPDTEYPLFGDSIAS